MSLQKTKRHLFSLLILLFLVFATGISYVLLQQNQDTRQQASTDNPYPDSSSGTPPASTVDPNSVLGKKGIVSTTFSGTRPGTQASCTAGVWMNSFCYMPGDELAGGKIIISSGRYNYPYIEDKETYESIGFEATTVNRVLGSTANLGEDCDGKGLAINGICYVYGTTVNGYLVTPTRLQKIEVSYADWQKAVAAYEKDGNTAALEQLYKKIYGVNFSVGNLYDPSASNADLLKAQVLLSALTSAEVLKAQAAADNQKLLSKGEMTEEQEAIFNFNLQIINDASLATRYQFLDQISAGTINQLTTNAAISRLYNELVKAEAGVDLNKLASEKFKEIFGYDPQTKHTGANGVLSALGIDQQALQADRQAYDKLVAKAKEEVERVNDEYQEYLTGESASLDDLKKAAINAGVVTAEQLRNLSEVDALALIFSSFSGTPLSVARAEAQGAIDLKQKIAKERGLLTAYADSISSGDGVADLGSLYALYELYTGNKLTSRVSDVWLKSEISKHNQQFALLAFQEDLNPVYLQSYYQANSGVGLGPDDRVPTNERVLLRELYGKDGEKIYLESVLPVKLQAAVSNFAVDGGASFQQVCREAGLSNCNINSNNAIEITSAIISKTTSPKSSLNIHELAINYSNAIFSNARETRTNSNLSAIGAMIAYSSAATVPLNGDLANEFYDEVNASLQAANLANQSLIAFDPYQTYSYAREHQDQISAITFGTAYGNALMNDNVFNRQFELGSSAYPLYGQTKTPPSIAADNNLGLTRDQALGLSFYQVGTQFFGMTTPAQDIASNYAIAVRDNYTGPAGTYLSNLAMTGASNMGLVDEYHTVGLGYYNDISSSIQAAGAYVSAVVAANQLNAKNNDFNPYAAQLNLTNGYIDPFDLANKEAAKTKTAVLYDLYLADSGVSENAYQDFRSDAEIQRSAAALKYETIEKVVVPVTATVLLPTAILSGAATATVFGLASSQFSIYQGAGMKAQALELQRYDIETRRYALVEMALAEGASEQEVLAIENDIANQVQVLNNQGNLMLVSSVVSGLMGFGGWASGAANASQMAGITNNLVSATARTGLILTKMGQIGGTGLNLYNFGTSGIGAYQAFAAGDRAEGWNNTLVAATSLTGIVGNVNNLRGLQTSGTHNLDFWADFTGAVTGTSTDVMQIQAACGNDSGAFDQRQCMNAWLGLALSAGMDVNQISSSHRLVRGDQQAIKLGELNAQLDVVGLALTQIKSTGKIDPVTLKTVFDLETRYVDIGRQITQIDPNFKVPSSPPDKNYQSAVDKIIADINVDRQQAESEGNIDRVSALDNQVALLRAKTGEIEGLRLVIENIDAQINNRGLLMSDTELSRLQSERTGLVDRLRLVASELEMVPSLRAQHESLLSGVSANYALANHQRLIDVDEVKINEIAAKIDQESLVAYKAELASNSDLKLENNNALRLLSLEAAADNETLLTKLTTQPAKENRTLREVISDFFSWRDRSAREAYYQALDLTAREANLRRQLESLPSSSEQAGAIARELALVKRQLVEQKHIIAQAVPAAKAPGVNGNAIGEPTSTVPNRSLATTLNNWRNGLRNWFAQLMNPAPSPTALRQIKQNLPTTITNEHRQAILNTDVVQDLTTRLLAISESDPDSANKIALIKEEIVEINKQKLFSKHNLTEDQSRMVAELVELHRAIFATDELSQLTALRATYQQRLSELKTSLLGANPLAADITSYQKLAAIQQFFKESSLIDSIKTASPTQALTELSKATEIRIELADPLLSVRLQALAQELELRAGITDGKEFFSSREIQVDTVLKILNGERVAVELTTSGGKTFAGGLVLRMQTDLFGHETGIYIAKPNDAPAIRRKLTQFLGVRDDEVVLLDHARLGDPNYVELISKAKYIVAETSSLEFVRNIANNFSRQEDSLPANQVYRKLTQNVAVYMDELQINLDPTRQAIVSVGQSSEAIPRHYEDAALSVGRAFEATLLKTGDWGLGEHDFLKVTSERGADIAKLQSDAQQIVFAELAREMNLNEADYNAIKDLRLEINALLTDRARLDSFLSSQFGDRVNASQAETILNQIDMVNAFASGLKMKYGTHYRRMVDEVLQANNGLNRSLTVPAADGAPNFGQSYNARMQAAMEYIGARAAGQNPDFAGLTASPNLAYRANISDYIGDLRQSSFGAVTGAMADGHGVVETGLGLVSYRSTDAVEKILGLEDSRTGGRINAAQSYQLRRQDYLQAIVRLQAEGQLDQSAGESTRGNLKIVLGFDGVVETDVAARYLGSQNEFANKTFFVKQADGSYAHMRVEEGQLAVIDGRSKLSTDDVQDMFRAGIVDAVIIMGRAGATGDSIDTNKSVLGITITSFDAPEGLVAQAGARIDRSGEIADQIALVVKSDASQLDQAGLVTNKMTEDDFFAWRTNVVKVQTEYERAKLTQALNQGVSSASTRVLSDLIRDSENPQVRQWASERLLEFYTQNSGRDLDLDGGDQATLLARQQQLKAEAARWKQLLADDNNRQVLDLVRQQHNEFYRRMTANAEVDPEKLAYASNKPDPATREEVITAADLQHFIDQHRRFVTADAESAFVASSGKPPTADQLAFSRPVAPNSSGETDSDSARKNITGDEAENAAASADLLKTNRSVAAESIPSRLSTWWNGVFGDEEREKLLTEQREQVSAKQTDLRIKLEEEKKWLQAELMANTEGANLDRDDLVTRLQEIELQLDEANLLAAAELVVIEQYREDYASGGFKKWVSSQLERLPFSGEFASANPTFGLAEFFLGQTNLDKLRQEQAPAIDQEALALIDEQEKIRAEIQQLEAELAGAEAVRQQQITARLSILRAKFITGDDDQVLAVIQERALANVAARAGFNAREGGWLRRLWGDQRSQSVAYSIGRSARNSLQVAPIFRNISRQHIQVIYGPNDTLLLRDLDSKYGTYLNGVRLTALTNAELKEGDKFVLGTALSSSEEVAFVVRKNESGQLTISSTQPAFLVDESQLSWGPFLVRQFWGVARPIGNYFSAAMARNMLAYQEGINSTERTWGVRLGEWVARGVNWAKDGIKKSQQRLAVLFNDSEENLKKAEISLQERKKNNLIAELKKVESGELNVENERPSFSQFTQPMKIDELFRNNQFADLIINLDVSKLVENGGNVDDLHSIIFENKLDGKDLPTEFPGKMSVWNWGYIRIFYIDLYIKNPSLTKFMIEKEIKGAHGSTSASILGVAQFGLLSQNKMKENSVLVASGEGVFGSAGLNNNNISFAQLAYLNDAITYSTADGSQSIEYIESYIGFLSEEIESNPDAMYVESQKIKKQNLQQTLDFLKSPSQSKIDDLKKQMILFNFPIVYLTNKSGETPRRGLESEYIVRDQVNLEEIKLILVPEKYLSLVKRIFAKYGANVEIVSMESTEIIENSFLESIAKFEDPSGELIDLVNSIYDNEGIGNQTSSSLEQKLVDSSPAGCSDCSVVLRMVENTNQQIEKLTLSGDNQTAIALAKQTIAYLQTHLFANQPLQDQLLADAEYTEAVLVKNTLEQEEALRALNRLVKTIEFLEMNELNSLSDSAKEKITEVQGLEVTSSPLIYRFASYIKFQLRNFTIALTYSRDYQTSSTEQAFKQVTRASLWFRPFTIFFGESDRRLTPFNLAVMEYFETKAVAAADPHQHLKQELFRNKDFVYYLITNQRSEAGQLIYQTLLDDLSVSEDLADYDLDIKNGELPEETKSYLSDLISQIFTELEVDLSMGRYVAENNFYENWVKEIADELVAGGSIEDIKQPALERAIANLSNFFASSQRFSPGSDQRVVTEAHVRYVEKLWEDVVGNSIRQPNPQLSPNKAIADGEKYVHVSDIDRYLNQFTDEEEKALFKKLVENIEVVDEETFDRGIAHLAEMIKQRLVEKNENELVLLVDGVKNKSGALMLEKLLPLLKGFSVAVVDFADYTDDAWSKTWSSEAKSKFGNKSVFIVDDATYSGARIMSMINAAEYLVEENKIHIGLVAATKSAADYLQQFSTSIDYSVQLKTAADVFNQEEYGKISAMLRRGTEYGSLPSDSSTYSFLYYKVPDNFPPGLTREHPFTTPDGIQLYLLDDTAEGIYPQYYQQNQTFTSLCSNCNVELHNYLEYIAQFNQLFANYTAVEQELAVLMRQPSPDEQQIKTLRETMATSQTEALNKLKQARNRVLNAHGYHNRPVALYMEALLDGKEALLRKTTADVNQALDSIYEATLALETMLHTRRISLRVNSFMGLGGQQVEHALTDEDVMLVAYLLAGKEDQGIEGLQSLVLFSDLGGGTLEKKPIHGQLHDLIEQNQQLEAEPVDGLRVTARRFVTDMRHLILLSRLKVNNSIEPVVATTPGQAGPGKPAEPQPPTVKSITPSPQPPSITPVVSGVPDPQSQAPDKKPPAFDFAAAWKIIAGVLSISLISSVVANQWPVFAIDEIAITTPTEVVAQDNGDLVPTEVKAAVTPTATAITAPTQTQTPSPSPSPSPSPTATAIPTEAEVKQIAYHTQMVHNSGYAEAILKKNGKLILDGTEDRWKPLDPELFPDHARNRNADDYLDTVLFFRVTENNRYLRDGSDTWCNIYVWDVTTALGVPLPHYETADNSYGYKEMRANDLYELLKSPLAQEEMGWQPVTAAEAQAYANQGYPTIATTPGYANSEGYNQSGHIAMIIPESGDSVAVVGENGEYYPVSAQAGRINGEGITTDIGFEGAIKADQTILYYVNTSAYEFIEP